MQKMTRRALPGVVCKGEVSAESEAAGKAGDGAPPITFMDRSFRMPLWD